MIVVNLFIIPNSPTVSALNSCSFQEEKNEQILNEL